MKDKNNRVRPSDDQLKKMAEEHLYYEMQMLVDMASLIPDPFIQRNDALRNAVLESFAVHARVLLGFFFSKPFHDDDVIAGYYFSDPEEWTKKASEIIGDFDIEPIRRRVNKEVVHLTLSRLDVKPEEKGWFEPGKKIHNIIKRALPEFLLGADEKLLGNRLLKTKKELLRDGL